MLYYDLTKYYYVWLRIRAVIEVNADFPNISYDMESWRLYEYISYVLRRTQKQTIKFPKNTIIERSSSWPVRMGLRIGCIFETNSNICTKCVQFGCDVFFFVFCFFLLLLLLLLFKRCNKSSHKI